MGDGGGALVLGDSRDDVSSKGTWFRGITLMGFVGDEAIAQGELVRLGTTLFRGLDFAIAMGKRLVEPGFGLKCKQEVGSRVEENHGDQIKV